MSELFADSQSDAPADAGYRVLARKYRPTTFSQLIGQEAMVRTIGNAIKTNRLPQAWMLTGVRGIGKTTTARIIAKALNCTGVDAAHSTTLEPCGVCDNCKMIAGDRHVDVLEMDAASHTGIEDIRDITDGVRYGPVVGRYKIYILDEIHMLSEKAFNALLKTLEEPPSHTKFIFATTEIRKVPVTVLSRCQRFDLRRIDSAKLAEHFAEIAVLEKIDAEGEAIKMIATAADGSVRDGLSLLDQAIARGQGKVTAVDVKDMLGLTDRGHSIALCRDLLRGKMVDALASFTVMIQAGAGPIQILQDCAELIHLLTRAQVLPDFIKDASLPEYDRGLLLDMADVKVPALVRAWQILMKGIAEVQFALDATRATEMVLIRLAYAADMPPPSDLVKQITDKIARGENVTAPAASPQGGTRARMGGGVVAIAPTPSENVEAITNFRDMVALFAAKREGGLYAELYNNIQLVKFEVGHIEIHTTPQTPSNFASRVMQCLSDWTGQRWVVSITDGAGEPSLGTQDKLRDQQNQDKVKAHPVVAAVLLKFPDAKMKISRKKNDEVVQTTAPDQTPESDEE